ncbi:enoyl-CoA hydratase-related protein [candidate division CSSED10-310 bacterium]|uniref:Enoyl-CoA hydratase-related protein n=1 Tax=candidate division CSSED10-310 bacterium TaxID=2855610 RepID=A0ABV6YTI9_UNCC1
MDNRPLILKRNGDLAHIILNRPAVHNALSIELSDMLMEAIQTIRKSTDIKFVVLKGAGNTFCAGDDIKEMLHWGNDEHGNSTQGANGVLRRVRNYQDMANSLEELDKMTICAVDGIAVGGGLEITMACDFVIATERAIWGMPEVDSGITPGWGGTTRMSRYIGKRRTKEINIIGALMPAQRAVEWGLWNRVVSNHRLDEEVEALLEVLRSKNQQACRQLKYIINRGCETDLYTAQGFEMLSGGLSAAVNGFWQVEDADQGSGVVDFSQKGELWKKRRQLAKNFWTDAPIPSQTTSSQRNSEKVEQLKEPAEDTVPAPASADKKAISTAAAEDAAESQAAIVSVTDIFEHMPAAFIADAAQGVDVIFQFCISGKDGADWYCIIKNCRCTMEKGIHDTPSCKLKMESVDFVSMMTGRLPPIQAFTSGKLQIEGDVLKAQLIQKLFQRDQV